MQGMCDAQEASAQRVGCRGGTLGVEGRSIRLYFGMLRPIGLKDLFDFQNQSHKWNVPVAKFLKAGNQNFTKESNFYDLLYSNDSEITDTICPQLHHLLISHLMTQAAQKI